MSPSLSDADAEAAYGFIAPIAAITAVDASRNFSRRFPAEPVSLSAVSVDRFSISLHFLGGNARHRSSSCFDTYHSCRRVQKIGQRVATVPPQVNTVFIV